MNKGIEVAWAAGLFEGEGSVFYRGSLNQVNVSIVMTDFEPIERFAEVVGAHARGPHVRGAYKPTWRVVVSKRQAVRDIYKMFKPWLSPRRIAQFEKALSSVVVHRVRQGESGYEACGGTTPSAQRGYKRHRRRGEEPCDACKEAYREYMASLRAEWRAAGRLNKRGHLSK